MSHVALKALALKIARLVPNREPAEQQYAGHEGEAQRLATLAAKGLGQGESEGKHTCCQGKGGQCALPRGLVRSTGCAKGGGAWQLQLVRRSRC